ncbi:MAG: vWA domain-containing protein [Polyangiaceae bacterium]
MNFGWDIKNNLWVFILAGIFYAFALYVLVWQRIVSTYRPKVERFGDPAQLARLMPQPIGRRTKLKALFRAAGLLCIGFAMLRPQFGAGEKLVPATNLDVVIVLDYSKSMYARDVTPNRISRAKVEVNNLIHRLPGARFGAVAFAGEPMSFPLTSDGSAIAQFFRGLDPNDMPVGGTSTARALDQARGILARDPKSKDHARVILLVTDGEDLEGDPVQVAERCKAENIVVEVVQIGGRTPETIPEMGNDGRVIGTRRDSQGHVLTTALSAEGEAQLKKIAETSGGLLVRSEGSSTGIDKVAASLERKMRVELAERVITLRDEAFETPLALGLFFLLLDCFMPETDLPRTGRFLRRVGLWLLDLVTPKRAERIAKTTEESDA